MKLHAWLGVLVVGAALGGCGDEDLQQPDPELEIACVEQPNADPVCEQGSHVRVAPVETGDSCNDDEKWLPISEYEADEGILRCQPPAPEAQPVESLPDPVPGPSIDCTNLCVQDGVEVREPSEGESCDHDGMYGLGWYRHGSTYTCESNFTD